MESVSLYQTFRPQKFSEVIGQDHIVHVLKAAIDKKEIGHAYLFIGDRGLGKTSIARIFSKEIGVKPVDLIEIDAASHRGIDAIRILNEQVYSRPLESPYKVYIIDEVHMLTKDAFNALLKTIEEPPSFCIFILATTEPHKVIGTIRSRCQEHIFRRASHQDISKLVTSVLEKLKLPYEQEAIASLALLGDGSYRDTLSHLQKIVTASDPETGVTHELLVKISGVPPAAMIDNVVESILADKQSKALSSVGKLEKLSVAPALVFEMIIADLRERLKLSNQQADMRRIVKALESMLRGRMQTKSIDRSFVVVELAIMGSFMHSSA